VIVRRDRVYDLNEAKRLNGWNDWNAQHCWTNFLDKDVRRILRGKINARKKRCITGERS